MTHPRVFDSSWMVMQMGMTKRGNLTCKILLSMLVLSVYISSYGVLEL